MSRILCKYIQFFNRRRTSSVSDKYSNFMAKDELEKVLLEATANENWNIANTKLMTIADATYNP